MKKMIRLAAFAFAATLGSAAYAAPNGCAGAGAQVTVAASSDFARNGFVGKCSNNVLLHYSQNNTAFGVVAGSNKGKSYFGGGSGGGGIKYVGNCGATGCTDGTEITPANANTQRDSS